MSEDKNTKSEQAKMILRMASAAASVARAKNWILQRRKLKDISNQSASPKMILLPGLDYLAVKKNPSEEERRLVEEHERTRLSRSRARIEEEFPAILESDSDEK
jgi:hypothetical protein